MGFLCTKQCQCRRSCKAYLGWNPEAEKACRKACNGGNPPIDAYTWWEELPPEIRMEYEGGADQAMYEKAITEKKSYTGLYIALGAVILILVTVLLFAAKKK